MGTEKAIFSPFAWDLVFICTTKDASHPLEPVLYLKIFSWYRKVFSAKEQAVPRD